MAKILVVEDDVVTQKLTVAILEKSNHFAVVSPNGRHALETLQVNSFDIIITDVMMPELGGRGLIEAIRKHPSPVLSNIPIIIISAVIKLSDIMDLMEVGTAYFVPKPFDCESIMEYVNLSLAELENRRKKTTKLKKGVVRDHC